ncbi:N-alpha-acetyltransferase 30 [Penaeus vannamei]|uniref:N-alpha-acetyltransferase 30 n=2 Tax=Penaeus TaxID=133894 RepID=UPI000F66B42B|nr:N-alpha-acetyltransferase 30-like [Penaeus vannamei]
MSEAHLRRVLVEDIPSLAACHTVAGQSADLAPVHSARLRTSLGSAMEDRAGTEGGTQGLDRRTVADGPSHTPGLESELREKLSFKNGVMNGMKIGTTDAEVHVPAIKPAKALVLDEQCSESSHESASKSDINGTVCNGHSVSEATSSSSIAISDTFSINSEKSSDSSHSCSGARPRTRNTSNSSQGTQPKSEIDLSSTSESLVTPEICISPVPSNEEILKIDYVNYENELQMASIMRLIQKDLSEPYSIYTYRYFIHNWPKLCFLAMASGEVVGAIVCKLDVHKKVTVRGYIAMLAVDHRFRKRKIGSNLVQRAIRAMACDDADEVVLETEITNKPALRLYENLGFVRDKRLFRYYLNGVDALRLKLWLR